MRTTAGDIRAALGQALCQRIGEKRYELWFAGKTKLTFQDGTLSVGVPNHFYQEWLQKTFGADLVAAAESLLGAGVQVRFGVDPELFRAARQREAQEQPETPYQDEFAAALPLAKGGPGGIGRAADSPLPSAGPTSSGPPFARGGEVGGEPPLRVRPPHQVKSRPRRWRRLEDFIVGSCNRVAHAAALHLIEEPGQGSQPLVFHGPVGTGKTHLLEGVYLGLRRACPDWKACFLTAEDFTNQFVQAIHHGKLAGFRKQFRECDALLLDDLHFLAKKPATQEEFLHTFDTLYTEDRPVVLTCDGHPRLADQFMPELTDRLLGGALCGLTTPERGTRLELLRHKTLGPDREPVPAEVLELLADQLRGNVRELEGALNAVWHFARALARPVSLELARQALAEVLRHSVRLVQLPDVEEAVCAALGLEPAALQSKKRGWMVSHPRMLAMYLARKHTAATYTEIGQRFGGRNHSTAVAGEKKVRQWLKEDAALQLGQRPLRVRDVIERIEREMLK